MSSQLTSVVLVSGLELIGTVNLAGDNSILTDVVLHKPLTVRLIPTPQGFMHSLGPVAASFNADPISIPEETILARGTPTEAIQQVYLRSFSSIEVVSPAQANRAGLTLVTP